MIAAALVAAAMAQSTPVGIGYSAFSPARAKILTGDSVSWHNGSAREHTVNGPDFASGTIGRYRGFSHTFAAAGHVDYLCRIHPGMSGEVDVEPILLDPPGGPVVEGGRIAVSGRAQAGVGAVRLERDSGKGFAEVGRAPVDADGMFRASLPPAASASYRAVADGGLASPPVRVLVLGQQVRVAGFRARGRVGVRVTTLPARPGGRVVLQLYERERFGWWPEARARLDRRGNATLRAFFRGPARARVVLTGRDGATPLATSRVVRISAPG